jgi:hypothetical protein
MPDINLDSLFIVGLILASVIGQIFKKKEKDTESKSVHSGNEKSEPTLEEVVKDVWAKASDSLYGINQAPSPIPPETSTQRLDESTQKEKDSIINETTEAITKSVESNLQKEVSVVEISRGEKLLNTLSSSSTLKNSFIIKEILDKPITLRDHADRY